MPRNLPLRPRLTPVTLVVAASVALALVVGISVLLPDGSRATTARSTPVTEQYAADHRRPGPRHDHPEARAEIDRVLAARPRPHPRPGQRQRAGDRAGALRGVRGPAVLPGRGWTETPEAELQVGGRDRQRRGQRATRDPPRPPATSPTPTCWPSGPPWRRPSARPPSARSSRPPPARSPRSCCCATSCSASRSPTASSSGTRRPGRPTDRDDRGPPGDAAQADARLPAALDRADPRPGHGPGPDATGAAPPPCR